ncbi:MAG: WYL domain-containing protein [Deltaproteobacteria bacterium]|nr:WYL domain-containing protein [Deltaproteobacteria bacterium]
MGDRLYLERILLFDSQIRKGLFPNSTALAHEFECSVKTAQRTIETFRDRYGAPLEYDASRRGYHYAVPDYRLPVTRLTDSEILALLVSRKLLADAAAGSLGRELNNLVVRLGKLLIESIPGPVDPDRAFSFRWSAVTPCDADIFGQTVNALARSIPLSFCYYSPYANVCTTRTVEPHHLVNYQGAWHLIAWCRLRGDWRDFVLARMSDCRLGTDPFQRREDGEWLPFLEESFGIFHGRERFEVTLRFSRDLARWARGQRWHPDQRLEETEAGELDLTLPVAHEREILMEVLKYGSNVEVLAPEWFRDRVRKEIEGMAKNYRT